jgi:ArsR family transcriptional regulator, arsenate/arsenite/antimonite-responsive transcriptional repressor / arsenate reductase (thioredoxin)
VGTRLRGEKLVGDVSHAPGVPAASPRPRQRVERLDSALVATDLEDPPRFVQLVANPLRWRLLRELVRSDRAVWELTERLDAPPNLVSYHLRRLRDGGLVRARRSTADGRETYYAIDLASCEQELRATGGALHPGLLLGAVHPPADHARTRKRPRALFLCTGNSARSPMAEALLTHMSGGAVDVASAGSHPKPLHKNAVRVMRRRGIDISGYRTKHLEEFASRRFDLVITLCDRVREVCPEFPSHSTLVHWSTPDPAQTGPTDRASYPAFEQIAEELETRIRFLLPLLTEPSTNTRRSSHVEQ